MPVPATVLENSSVGPPPGGYQLLVMDPERFVTHALPISGTLTIGRGDQVDVRLTDPLASRSHARLHVGATFELEDLDSSNKTRLHDAPLVAWQRTVVAPGEAFSIGATMLMIQQRGGILPRPRRLWPHGYFEARLEEECARSESSRDPFAVVRVHVEGAGTPARVAELIRMALRLPDMLAEYAPGEYEVLLADTEAPFASAIAQDITAKLREAGLQSRTGIAIFPRDGQSPEELIGVACTRVRGVEEAANAVVVQDALMERLYSLADRAAKGTISVLIVGETGVGKEVMAERIHKLSPRANKPFLCLNCASLSENLLTSELFGHERGAFTGAVEAKPGLLETAPGGTVFLDEVGELPLALQVTLLRVLETRVVMRVGGVKPRSIDVRFVAATNCDLESDVAAGKFRRDLYFRLNGIMLQIPPLRARRVEIQPLAKTFIEQFSGQLGRSRPLRLGTEALRYLESYVWPGNIRELRNVIERASLLCAGDEILPEHLPLEAMTAASSMVQARVPAPPVDSFGAGAWNPLAFPPWARSQTSPPTPASVAPARAAASASFPETERERILRVLAEHGGNQTRAAAALGMARSTLVLRLNSYNIVRPRKP